IGDEILIGQVVNSNSAWIADALTGQGIRVDRILSIADDHEEIVQALQEAEARADLVFLTGGLGPTSDDITKQTLAEYFNSQLVENEAALDRIRTFLSRRDVEMNELNKAQAMLPDNCIMIPNRHGTASGMWFSKNDTEFLSMPGVPYEMETMMSGYILPRLKKQYDLPAIVHRTVLVQGIAESHLARMLEEYEKSMPPEVKLAYLPSPGRVRLRLTSSGTKADKVKAIVQEQVDRLIPYIPDGHFFGYEDEQLEKIVGVMLSRNKKTLALAESCTGGTIAQLITSVPGSSKYFLGSVVAYSNQLKLEILGVQEDTISEHGAVSRQVVEQMASGVMKRSGADYSIATSGIAGPDGGTPDKPVGTTWIAVASAERTESALFNLGEHRGRNIQKASLTGLNMLRKLITDENC
ncbi:MAG: competence/damage-inducible protein A, partial [Bacteroidales bacterium]|nr:competence/damage-inducible protein A [Bacteroidales bacterium]